MEHKKPKLDRLAAFFSSLKAGREPISPTMDTIEKSLTSGPLAERTDLGPGDLVGVVYLEWVGKTYDIPEARDEAEIWKQHFISKGRQGRAEAVSMIQAKIAVERELAEIRARMEAMGRERR